MNILIPGQYPRSEQLVAATRNYERGRIALQDLEKAQQEDLQHFLTLQQHCPYLSTGLFHWQDLLRPFVEFVNGLQAGPLVCFYETNTFWRILENDNEAVVSHKMLDAWLYNYFLAQGAIARDAPLLFTLPFIYLFKDYSHGVSLEAISTILLSVAKALLALPNKVMCFVEPTFGWRSLSEQEKILGEQFLSALKGFSQVPVFLCSSFAIQKELDFLYSLPVDGFGIDFYANSIEDTLSNFPEGKTLIAGVINTASTKIEEKVMIKDFIRKVRVQLPETLIYLAPNASAELLPRTVMDKKIANLQECSSW